MSILNLYVKSSCKMSLRNRIKWWFRRAKYVWQRAHWGFSEYDVWDFETYHAELIAAMLSYLAEHGMSHPWDITDEEWKTTLKTIAVCFKQWNEDLPTPAYDAFRAATKRMKNDDGSVSVEAPDELYEAWREELKTNDRIKKEKLKEGFDLLYKFYPTLWD